MNHDHDEVQSEDSSAHSELNHYLILVEKI